MRKLLAILFALSALNAQGAHVYFNIQNFTTAAISNKTFKIAPASMPSTAGGATIAREPFTTNTGTGIFYISNVVAGYYDCTLTTPITPTTFRILVPDTNGVVDSSTIRVTVGAVTGTYDTTASDARFVLRTLGWSTNQALTNAIFGNAGLRPAFATKDSSFVFFSNSIVTLTKNSTLAIGDSSGAGPNVTFDDAAYISSPLFSFDGRSWNFKATPNSNTVARLSDITNITVSNANVIFLSANGNDATAIRGDPSKPFLTWTNAVAALQNNDTLYVLPGTYLAWGAYAHGDESIYQGAANLVSRTNVTIEGIGMPIIRMTNFSAFLEVAKSTNITIRNLSLQGTRTTGGAYTNLACAIYLHKFTRQVLIENVRFANIFDHCIGNSPGSSDDLITNLVVRSCTATNWGYTNGVPLNNVDGMFVGGGGRDWIIEHNTLANGLRGMELESGGWSPRTCQNIVFRHNLCVDLWAPAVLGIPTATDDFTDISIVDNDFILTANPFATAPSIISITGGRRFKVNRNNFYVTYGPQSYCVSFGSSALSVTDIEVKDNWFYNVADAIVFSQFGGGGVVTNVIVTGNTSYNHQTYALHYQGGGLTARNNSFFGGGFFESVRIENPGYSCNNLLENNSIVGSASYGINLAGGTSNNIVVRNFINRSAAQPIFDSAVSGHNFIGPNSTTNGYAFYGTNDLDATRMGFFNRWAGTNTGAWDVAGPASFYGAATNRSTVRNMGAVTNDTTETTVGAAQLQSTLNVTGAGTFGGTLTVTGAVNGASSITASGGFIGTNGSATTPALKITGIANSSSNLFEAWSNNVKIFSIGSNGVMTVSGDAILQSNSTNIGTFGVGGTLRVTGNISGGSQVQAGLSFLIGLSSYVYSPSGAGTINIVNGNLSSFSRLQFGGTTTNWPALWMIQAGTNSVANVLGVGSADSANASGAILEIKATPNSMTNNNPSADSARIFASLDGGGVAQLWVKAEDGTTKQITEHAIADAPPFLVDGFDDMPNISKEIQPYLGKVRWINRSREAFLTQMQFWGTNVNAMPTNKTTFIYVETFAKYNNRLNLTNGNGLVQFTWSGVQAEHQAAYDAARAAELAAIAKGETNVVARPAVDIRKPVPAWMAARGVN